MNNRLIGITTCNTNKSLVGSASVREYSTYRNAIGQFGMKSILIRMDSTERELEKLYEDCCGFLLSGGDDVDPAIYHETQSSYTKGVHRQQDDMEIGISKWAAIYKKPLLGICRGCQVINVAFGGSLYQHVSNELRGSLQHDQHKDLIGEKKSRSLLFHKVSVRIPSLLYRITGTTQLKTNSLHHQGLKEIGKGLEVCGVVPDDGLVEAVEIHEHPFFLGVQWHPEELTALPEHNRIFEAFTEACKK